jgi:soluble lytic murein transglycosylase-like protein
LPDPALAFVLAILEVESGFRPTAVSPVGAVGLLQLMPRTAGPLARELKLSYARYGGIRQALRDPYFNLTLGLNYLSQLRERYEGLSPYWFLAAYNMGPTRLNRLRAQTDFRPVATVTYYRRIRRKMAYYRHFDPARGGKKNLAI